MSIIEKYSACEPDNLVVLSYYSDSSKNIHIGIMLTVVHLSIIEKYSACEPDNLGILIGGVEWPAGHGETATLTLLDPDTKPPKKCMMFHERSSEERIK